MRLSENAVRNELNIAAGRYGFQPAHVRQLLGESGDLVRDERPERSLIVGRDNARQGDAPRLETVSREADAVEGNIDQDDIAPGRQPAFRPPNRIETVVVVGAFVFDAVRLNAERVHQKLVSALA